MAETREGGVYRVGDEWQDANGNKVDEPKKSDKPEVEDEDTEPKRGPGRPKGS